MARSASDPSTVFAAGDRVWKSTDGGAHWALYGKRMIRVHVSDLEVGPGPVDNVLMVANGDVYRSDRRWPVGAQHRPREPEFFPAEDLARGNANPNLMLAMTAMGVIGPESQCYFMATHRSTDGGRTWASRAERRRALRVPPAAPLSPYDDAQLLMHPTAPLTRLGPRDRRSGARSLWRTTDLGHTWQPEAAPPNAVSVDLPPPYDTLVAVDALGAVSHRPVAGGTWTSGYGPSCAAVEPEPFVALTPFGCAGSAGIAFAAVAGPAGGRAPIGVGQTFPAYPDRVPVGCLRFRPDGADRAQRDAPRRRLGRDDRRLDVPAGARRELGAVDGRHRLPRRRRRVRNVATDAAGRALAAGGKLYRRGRADSAWIIVPSRTSR